MLRIKSRALSILSRGEACFVVGSGLGMVKGLVSVPSTAREK